ncbi:MAG: hypothetical protein DRI95_06575 [Bacteroidetes bacterium]|nr:MAG: hypothetical protein DRI95_06575 [Bacteroidota bacterium]
MNGFGSYSGANNFYSKSRTIIKNVGNNKKPVPSKNLIIEYKNILTMKRIIQQTINPIFVGILLLTTTCEPPPKITKLEIGSESNVTECSATISAVFIDVSENVTAFGHCWATGSKPTVSDYKKPGIGTAKKGEFTCNLTGLSPNTKYFVRAYAMDVDKAIYSSTEIFFTTLEAKYINLTAPVATDNWTKGSTQNITWTDNISENVIIELYKGGTLLEDIIASTESDGSYNWTLPDDLALGIDYRIKVSSVDDASISAQSELFETSEDPYITILVPTTGTDWQKGSDQTISWNDNLDGNVKIELFKTGSKSLDISISTESDGSIGWTVPTALEADNDYKIKITSVEDENLFDESNNFTITGLSPTIVTLNASSVSGTSATLNGTVNANGEEATVSFEWGETTTYGNTVNAVPPTVNGTVVTAVSADISGLSNGITYHFRLLAENQDESSLGNDISFITHSLASITTNAITEITSSSATSGGYVSSDGGSPVTDRGVCWGTSENPTVVDYSISSGTGIGTFTSSLTGLSDNTLYYVRAYATNSVGTAYGNQQSFTTEAPFIQITAPVGTSSWQVGTSHSIEWNDNISENVKIELFIGSTYLQDIEPGITNTGSYSWLIPILAQSDLYKIKISSVDNESIYDESEEFTIITPSGSTGTVTDYDDNTYDAIKIGNQWWMVENLKVTHYSNGDEIPLVTGNDNWVALLDNNTDKVHCYYNDNTGGEAETYGALYTWAAAMDGAASTDVNPSGIPGVCPSGWHLPSDDEWKELEVYLGMSQSAADNINWRGTDQGGRLKESGTLHWDDPNTGANNLSGFTGLPGGFRPDNTGICVQIRTGGLWWSTTQYDGTTAWYRHLQHERETVGRWRNNKSRGFSVRCVKD